MIKINCKELRLHKQELLEIVRIGVPAGMPFYITCSLQDVAAGQIRGLGKSAEPMLVSLVGLRCASFVDIRIFADEPNFDEFVYCISAVMGNHFYCAGGAVCHI